MYKERSLSVAERWARQIDCIRFSNCKWSGKKEPSSFVHFINDRSILINYSTFNIGTFLSILNFKMFDLFFLFVCIDIECTSWLTKRENGKRKKKISGWCCTSTSDWFLSFKLLKDDTFWKRFVLYVYRTDGISFLFHFFSFIFFHLVWVFFSSIFFLFSM